MASLSRVTSASVLRVTSSVKMPALNVGGVVAYTTAISSRSETYESATDVSTVFGASSPITLAAGAFFARSPSPSTFKVFRAALPSTKIITIVPTVANSKAYSMKINGTEVTYTSDASATGAEICGGIKSAIDALAVSGLTVTEDDTTITLTGTAGTYFSVELTSGRDDGVMVLLETTTDPGIATDLAAILAADSDWFMFGLVDNSVAINTAASVWAEANGRFFIPLSQDNGTSLTVSSSDIGSVVTTGTRDLSAPVYHHAPREFMNFALMSALLSATPGKRAAFHKALQGISVSDLNATEIGYLEGKNYTYYVEYGSLNRTDGGKVGSGEWIDIIFGSYYYDARWEQMSATLTLSEPDKIDFDEGGIEKHANVARSLAAEMLTNNFIRLNFTDYPEFGYKLTTVDIDDVSAADLASRLYAGTDLEVTLKGAIKKTTMTLRLVL